MHFYTEVCNKERKAYKCSLSLFSGSLCLYLSFIESLLKTKSPTSFRASVSIIILQTRWSAAIWWTQIQAKARKASDWIATRCYCCSSFPVCPKQCKRHRGRGSSINAGGLVWQERYCLDWGGIVLVTICPHHEVAWNPETLGFNSNTSPSWWVLKEWQLTFTCCRRISEKQLPSLKRQKVRADHVELERLPHYHECAFSDIIKMHQALRLPWADCAQEENEPWKMKQTSLLSSYLLLCKVSLDWLHQTVDYRAWRWLHF